MAHKDVVNCGDGCSYQILNLIGKTASSSLYRAHSLQHGTRALLRILDPENRLPERMEGFRREYRLLQLLDIPGVIKPVALVDAPESLMMVLDDVEAAPFENFLNQLKSDLPLCLRLGIQLAHMLAGLHAARLFHGDLRPANLLLDSAQKLYLADLSRATCDTQQRDTGSVPSTGDWAYISPEQTGRMNRVPDYRSDFYSLGVMLYRMLTGQLPFHGKDALEWAHCHIARLPVPPAELCPAIPPMVSAIVMKLLAKMPEDRYHSGHGLRQDLETCLAQWETQGAIAPFVPGAQDVPGRLQIPRSLVGREAEAQLLRESLETMTVSGRPALLLVSGSAGVGKSAIVHELRQPVVERGGYFISGKFDQYQRDIPYATVTQAFRELVQQILAESKARISEWRQQIQEAVGTNGQLIVDVLPQMELIIGKQVPVPELPPAETQNRFRVTFEKFISVFTQQAHPLTLFLDDLQWADAASLRLIKELVTASDQRFLLVIGAYRDNEVSPSHPMVQTLDDMRREGMTVTEVALLPLSEVALSTFIDAMLQCERCTTAPTAHLIYEKTGGNPLFVIQFITALAEERLITFDAAARTWRWELAGISAKSFTDNVAELMISKFARLPAPAQAALQRLACLGSSAPVDMLMMLCRQPEAHIQTALFAAARAGLILQTEDTVSFQHDRVREAAYLSIPAATRAALHLQIGRLLMAGKTQSQIEETVFTIVNQFNSGAEAITDAKEKALLCQLNFLAGTKAKAAVAFHSARNFLERARALLPADAWQVQYQDAFTITLALSECEYLVGNLEKAEELAELTLSKAQSNRDRTRVYLLRMQLYQMVGRFDAAVNTMIEAARLFNMVFPDAEPEVEAAIDAEMREISACLQGRRIADVANGPQLLDEDLAAVIALLVEAIPATYFVRREYSALVSAMATRLSLHHGHTEDSCNAYSAYGMVPLARTRDISSAIEFSEMALELNRKLHGRRRTGRLLVTHAFVFHPLKYPFSSVMPLLEQSLAACIEVGDLAYSHYVTFVYFWSMFQQGIPLNEVSHTVSRHIAFARQNHNDTVIRVLRFQQQLVANLKGKTRGLDSFNDDDFDEGLCFSMLERANMSFGIESSHVLKLISAFIYGDYRNALASAEQAFLKSSKVTTITLVDSALHFYFALTLAARYAHVSEEEQRKLAGLLAEERERYRLWADHCPQNFLSCHALISAEIARIEGRRSDAEQLYEQSIRSARDNRLIQNEAIAFELASSFYRSRGLDFIAEAYLREARAAYLRWGADGKVAQLDARYPSLRKQSPASGPADDCTTPLDVLSVAKASQAISSHIVLNELADTLLRIVLENAGAQAGCLLFCGGEELELAADANVDQGEVRVRLYAHRAPSEASLPSSILNYVQRSRELVLLPDVTQAHPFSADDYFDRCHPKSVLCLPILRQDTLIGLLYLENKLVTNAFMPERVTVLQLLASQAAISLENARLYANLLQENRERQRAEEALRKEEARIRRLVDANIIGVIFGDVHGAIHEANDAFLQLSGYSPQDLRSGALRWDDMTPSEYRVADEQALEELQKTGTCPPYEKEFIRKDGHRIPVLVGAALIEGSHNQGVSFVLDLSARKQAEEQIRYMAHHDALTGLPNRVLLQDRMEQAIAYARRNQGRVAVLFIDLDYFKNINDSLGHHIGDALLQMTAARLQKCLREGDSLAKLGGDEFVLCLPLLNDGSNAARIAQKVIDTLSQPFRVEGNELHINASIGISLYPDDGTDVKTLMRTADTAMNHAKERGRGNFQFFTEALNHAAQQRLHIDTRLRYALAHDEFVLHYQPQVDMESGVIFSVEALLRWQRPGTQPISCGAFIEHAEESGLIVPIGEWTLRQACKQLKIWHEAGYRDLKMAVNLSPRQLQEADFCLLVEQILHESNLPATALELEITESTLLPQSDRNLAILTRLNEMGIQLSVDDFGTGYSSLAYLQRFPVHALKIDQSFVRDIGKDHNDTALITAIIAMGASLRRKVMAEGVETLYQAQFLRAHGCLAAQGFYYSKALPAEALSDLLRVNSKLITN